MILEEYINSGTLKPRLFVDMDGTLAVFQQINTLEKLYEKGYFSELEPQENVMDAVRHIVREHPEVEVFILSSVLSDSKYALEEKNEWLDRYLPEIDREHRIFPPCGENKLDYVPDGIRSTDYLLDDYTNNLTLWEPPAKGIKLLNGINHTNETWKGNMLRYDKEPEWLADDIVKVVQGMEIRDERPLLQIVRMENQHYKSKGYISEEEKNTLVFLTKPEALAAQKEGIHICYVNDYSEYHGIHKDEYHLTELKSEKGVQTLYDTFGSGVVHKACISPGYVRPIAMLAYVKVLLQEKNTQTTVQRENTLKKVAGKELSL